MPDTICCDISKYQPVATNAYKRPWLIFRSNDGTILDEHFQANFAWAAHACKARWLGLRRGRMRGFTVYGVYEPGIDVPGILITQIHKALAQLPRRLRRVAARKVTVMLDVESWGGKITGDHSPEIQRNIADLVKFLGSPKRVIAYANTPDFQILFPTRPQSLQLIVARYSTTQPALPNMIGWQYTDGETRYPVPADWPRASAPFGNCDHNIFQGLTPEGLAATLGVADTPKNTPKPPPPPPVKDGETPNIDQAVELLNKAQAQHRKLGPVRRAIDTALAVLKGAGK